MKAFITAFQNETLKHKGLATIYIVFFLPVAVVFLFTLFLAGGSEEFSASADPWLTYFGNTLYVLAVVYPILFAVLGYSIQELEFRSNGYFRLFLFPVSKPTLYFAKTAFLFIALLFSLGLGFTAILFSGKFLDWWEPDFAFSDYNSLKTIAWYFVRFIPFLFTIALIHFLWSFYYHNLLVTLALVFLLLLIGIFFSLSPKYYWFFAGSWFRNADLTVSLAYRQLQTNWFFTDIAWAIGLLCLGVWKFSKVRPETASS